MRFLLALIGYAATATVLSAALGVGYLWQTERLTDERMFRIVAVLHGVNLNLDQDLDSPNTVTDEVPPEEPSLIEEERLQEIALRNHEAKQASLARGRIEFDHALEQLVAQRDRFDEIAREITQRLEQESADTADEGVKKVVGDLVAAKAETAKLMLLKMLDRGGSDPASKQQAMDDVVRLINTLPPNVWSDIINKFKTEVELTQLHEIQVERLDGGKKQRDLNAAMEQIKNRDFGS